MLIWLKINKLYIINIINKYNQFKNNSSSKNVI